MRRQLLALVTALLLPALAAGQSQPRAVIASTVQTTNTGVNSLLVGCAVNSTTCTGGIKSGGLSVNGVGIVASDGRIPAISTTFFASLSGANLTGILESAITDSTILARVAADEAISGQWTFSGVTQTLASINPVLLFNETDAAADNKVWRHIVNGTGYNFQISNDAGSVNTNVLSFARSGTTAGVMTVGASQTLVVDGSVSAPALSFASDTNTGIYRGGADLMYFAANGSRKLAVSSTGVGFDAPATGIDTVTYPNTTAMTLISTNAAPLIISRNSSDGTLIDLQRDFASQGSISVAAGVVAYNTFMGAHYTQLQPGQGEIDEGTVVVSAGRAIPLKPRRLTKAVRILTADRQTVGEETIDVGPAPEDPNAERFVYVEQSSRRNQVAVYGVWHADLGRTAAGMSWGDPDAEVYQIASVGQYTAWVTDTCGPITTGVLLATSPIPGLAEAQCQIGVLPGAAPRYDGTVRDHTLGRSLVDVDWRTVPADEDGVRKIRIPVVLHAG